jgi:hypothetical protein
VPEGDEPVAGSDGTVVEVRPERSAC